MAIPGKKKVLDVVVVHPPVEGRTGEVVISLRNDREEGHLDVSQVVVREVTGGGSPDSRRFAIIPSEENGGYAMSRIAPATTVRRAFSLRPVRAEVGTETDFEVQVEVPDGKPMLAHFTVQVEARPEIYAAIGAAEWLRENLLKTYERMQKIGREKQGEMQMTWPSPEAVDTARAVLGEESFKKVFEAIQLGARIIDGVARKSGGGSS